MNPPTPREPGEPGADGEKLTLYCLAHAGGSAMPYSRWNAIVPPSVTVTPLELPGHGARIREPLMRRADLLAAELVRTMRPHRGERFALFGHSFGAVLAYELARRLDQLGLPPAALLVSGRNGPGEPLSHRPIHKLPDDAFITALNRYGGMPQALLDQPELLRMYLPALRADLEIVETYTRPAGPPLDVPLVAFGGRRDSLTDPAGLVAWERETSRAFELALIPGGHFFLEEPDFREALTSRLSRLVAAAPAAAGSGAAGSGTAGAGSVAEPARAADLRARRVVASSRE
ncbi:thioesterase II family protein [Wenjunlia tyrosinilytica]|uniref:Thioesterase n=1 Tax=Wenjunlia tyrosinilytica TaxID=1544741 RepID=A0A917ZV96_9ACTN|nr:alpha/beta fold hydrolase [Wenjunlia tyrosinilytica]GGO95483.1 thioesterase [Wenjunlia tyrosinilytica]